MEVTFMKKIVLKAVAKVSKKMAIKACGNASYYAYHQPKEPEAMKHTSRNKNQL